MLLRFMSGIAIAVVTSSLCLSPVVSSGMDLIGLDHFAITVTDLQQSANWYSKYLGFHVLHKWKTTWMIGRDNIKIGLFERPKAKPIPNVDSQLAIQHVAFLVDGDKFESARQELIDAGLKFDPVEDTGIAYSIFLHDPDGYELELTTYHAIPGATSAASPSVPPH